jgi:putative phage-type endonuclease
MKIINLEQGTPEWLSWRKTVITATDCSCIMGNNPWTTAYQCWQKKLGLIEETKSSPAMERGKRLEPIARERFIALYGIQVDPIVVESSEFDFLGASLDGLSKCGQYILEVKTGGQNLLEMAKQGIIPQYYMDQMQHQLLVTKAKKCFYQVTHEDHEKEIIIDVYPDPTFADRFLPKAREFLRCIAFSEPPALQDSDYRDMTNTAHWKGYAQEYQRLCKEIKSLEELKESYRKELIKLSGDHNCKGDGIKVIKTIMKGRVAYDEIPEIKDVDLEKHRKPSSTIWKICVDDKS